MTTDRGQRLAPGATFPPPATERPKPPPPDHGSPFGIAVYPGHTPSAPARCPSCVDLSVRLRIAEQERDRAVAEVSKPRRRWWWRG